MTAAACLLLAALGVSRAGATSLEPFEAGVSSAGFFPRATLEEAGVSPEAAARLLESPAARDSDALLVVKEGRVVVERYFGSRRRPLPLASVTKAVVSVAVMGLIADGRISSEKQLLSSWLVDWSSGPKAAVTLGQVMSHTSGLACAPGVAEGDGVLWRQRDMVAFARAEPLDAAPGTKDCYNNAAVELLAEVIRQAAGRDAADYLAERVFRPLGISEWAWGHDRSGNADVYGGLSLDARGLAALGQLLLDGGRWRGRALLPEAVVRRFTGPSAENPRAGYLWFVERERRAPGDLSSPRDGRPIGFFHTGSFGEIIAVYPEWRLVAVRLRDRGSRASYSRRRFDELFDLFEALGRRQRPG